MTEPQIRELFTELAGEPVASRVDPQFARRRGRARLRWRRAGLAGASAVATAAVITTSLAISGAMQDGPTGPGGDVAAASLIAKVPPYFVALPVNTPGPTVVGASASGAVLGTVVPPKGYPVFTMVTGAGDGRTFIFAAARGWHQGPVTFYRLVLSRSGHPGRLSPLPLPPETSSLSGLAVSPDGSKLAMSVFNPRNPHVGAKIQIFSLATGAVREWAWPGAGWIGWSVPLGPSAFAARSLSWAADNRRLLFQEETRTHSGATAQARLLDTAAAGGNLLASSTRVPIPSAELYPWGRKKQPPFRITGPLLLTGDGTKIVAPTSRTITHGAAMLGAAITEFSVRTGMPVKVLSRQQLNYDNGTSVLWVNHSGTLMIAGHPLPNPKSYRRDSVIGVQTPTRFIPLPPGVQRLLGGWEPDW